jgi:hypothetical protein
VSWSQSSITRVNRPVEYGTHLFLSWTSTAPAGTTFQVYVDRKRAWHGTGRSASIPLPPTGQVSRIDVGTVGDGEAHADFSASLSPAPMRYALLSWEGGTYESPDISGFLVYSSDAPGGPVDYTTSIGTVPAYTSGIITDGYGYGGYGDGGYGEAAASYTFTSGQLLDGVWTFGVKPFDTAGNIGPTSEVSVSIMAPPFEPPLFGDGNRLHYTFDASTEEATLIWQASTE